MNQVTFNFTRNGAGLKGAAVFANTLTTCVWVKDEPNWSFEKVLKWGKNFIYEDNYLTGQDWIPEWDPDKINWSNQDSSLVDISTDTTNFKMLWPVEEVIFGINTFFIFTLEKCYICICNLRKGDK